MQRIRTEILPGVWLTALRTDSKRISIPYECKT